MPALDLSKFVMTPLEKSCNRKRFSCGISSLDEYIQLRASQDMKRRVSVTYTLLDTEKKQLAGYYTLSATAIALVAVPESMRKKLPPYELMPATLLGRLAVDVTYKGYGLSELLLVDALKNAYQASSGVASIAVLVDAINNEAEQFYKKYGFQNLHDKKNRMMFPMAAVAKI